jgi:catechol 2,3-dioxygenase
MSSPPPVVVAIGHLSVQTADFGASIEHAVSVMGLHVSYRDDHRVLLTPDAAHHRLELVNSSVSAVNHVGLVAAGAEALAEVRHRVKERGLRVVNDGPIDEHVQDAFSFVGPEGFVFEVYIGMTSIAPPQHTTGVRGARLGHLTLNSRDTNAFANFLTEVLDFKLSDTIAGEGYFLRCNSEHHGVGLLSGSGTLHHHAWPVQSIADLGRVGDLLDERRERLLWGPVRHGAGNNIAAYFADPAGAVVEYYTDMEHIFDDDYVPRTWTDDRWFTRWAPARPADFRSYGLPPADHADAS